MQVAVQKDNFIIKMFHLLDTNFLKYSIFVFINSFIDSTFFLNSLKQLNTFLGFKILPTNV